MVQEAEIKQERGGRERLPPQVTQQHTVEFLIAIEIVDVAERNENINL